MSFLNYLTRGSARCSFFAAASHGALFAAAKARSRRITTRLLWGATTVAIGTGTFTRTIYLDSDALSNGKALDDTETIMDTATSIAFPATIRVPSKIQVPPMTLVGLGVRKVSFLGIKVYSVGFYADLENPDLKIPLNVNTDEKMRRIVQNTSCAIRIVPVRTTSHTHLRDAFVRALQARLILAKQNGDLSEEEAQDIGSPMRKLKSLFPNSPLPKHTPLDIYLTAPAAGKPRALVFNGFGAIENDWVATEFVLHYFEVAAPSPPLQKSVMGRLESFQK